MATPEVIASGIETTSLVPAWSPSGEWILFSRGNTLEMRSAEGKTSQRLPGDSWIGATFSNDGKLVYAIRHANSRPELVSFALPEEPSGFCTRLTSRTCQMVRATPRCGCRSRPTARACPIPLQKVTPSCG